LRTVIAAALRLLAAPRARFAAALGALCLVVACAGGNGPSAEGPADPAAPAADATPLVTRLSERILANPNDPTLYFRRAVAFRAFNNQAALADFKRAWQLDSTSPDHALGLAEQYFEMNESRAALGVLSGWLRHNPPDPEVLRAFADMALITRQYEVAIGALNRLLQMDRFDAELYFLKGRNQRLLGDTAAAVSSYQTAIELDPELEAAHLELGVLLAVAGDERGLRYLGNVLALNDSNLVARYQVAKYHQDFGQWNDAVDGYEEIVRRDPQNGDALYNLGTIWFAADSLEKASRLFGMTVAVEPARAMAHYALGLTASRLGRREEALRYLRQAIQLDPELEPALVLFDSLQTFGR
jgi:tetratricopeptide (TPR) repeat protein